MAEATGADRVCDTRTRAGVWQEPVMLCSGKVCVPPTPLLGANFTGCQAQDTRSLGLFSDKTRFARVQLGFERLPHLDLGACSVVAH